jgi:hypothetical protein
MQNIWSVVDFYFFIYLFICLFTLNPHWSPLISSTYGVNHDYRARYVWYLSCAKSCKRLLPRRYKPPRKLRLLSSVMWCHIVWWKVTSVFVSWKWKRNVHLKHFNQSMWCQIPESDSLHSHCCENLKSYMQEKCVTEGCMLNVIVLI